MKPRRESVGWAAVSAGSKLSYGAFPKARYISPSPFPASGRTSIPGMGREMIDVRPTRPKNSYTHDEGFGIIPHLTTRSVTVAGPRLT